MWQSRSNPKNSPDNHWGSVPVSNNRPKIKMVIRNWLHLDIIWSRVIEMYVPSMDRHNPLAQNGSDMVWNAVINHGCDQWLYNGRFLDTKFEWLFDFGNWLLVPVIISNPSKNQWISWKNRERTNSFIQGYLTCGLIFGELWWYIRINILTCWELWLYIYIYIQTGSWTKMRIKEPPVSITSKPSFKDWQFSY